ncbi:enoyl-CoA hydratase/isomerase family protein [Streptomyces spectabilis]|uniref:enoyl-CoA hydratase/isomerase family protein n=1 Tax=Streptomyces spectabilis TaxID=68270 RepID=UPI0034028640
MPGRRPAFPHIGWDPTPGDVQDTRDLAKKLGGLADELGASVRELERISCGAWKGEAARAFVRYVGEDVAPLVRKSHESFGKASRALHRWAGELQDFQDEADRLEKSAGEKLEARGEAKAGSKEMAEASGDVTHVTGQVHDLENRYARAAHAITEELDKAGDIAPDEPGFWDKLTKGIADAWDATGRWLKDHADTIKLIGDLLSDLSGVLGMLAIITAPFEPVGAIFATAAVLTSGLALVTHITAKAAGADVNWLSIGFDALGTIPGVSAFTKGVKVASRAQAAARATQLGSGFQSAGTVGRNVVGMGDNVIGGMTRTVRGRRITIGGHKLGGVIKTEGGLMNRMNLLTEQTIRGGQLVGTKGIPGLRNIDSMSNLGRGIDAGIKIGLKAVPISLHTQELMNPGDRLEESAQAH